MKIPLSFLILAMLVISGCVEKEPSITQNELYFCNHDNDCFNPCRGSTPVDKDYFCVNKLEFETNKDRYKQFACLGALPTYVCVCENNRCTAKTREPNTDLNQTEKTNCENSGGKWVQECTTTGLCSPYFCDCDLGREETDNHTIIIERYKLEKNNVCVECETNDECAEGLVYGVRGCVQSRDYCKEYHRYCENGVCIFKSVEYGNRQCVNNTCIESMSSEGSSSSSSTTTTDTETNDTENTTEPPASNQLSCAYMCSILKDGSITKAVNSTGGTVFSGENSHDVIQNALDNLTPDRVEKETIILMDDFVIDDKLIIPRYTIFDLNGHKLTLANNSDTSLITITDKDYVEIKNGILDGNANNQNVRLYGIRVYAQTKPCSHIMINDITIKNAGHHAITVSGNGSFYNEHITVTDIFLENIGTETSVGGGVIFYYVRDGYVENITIEGNNYTKFGVECVYGNNITIKNVNTHNLIGDNRIGAAGAITPKLSNVTLSNLDSDEDKYGLLVGKNAVNITLNNLDIRNSEVTGIKVLSGAEILDSLIDGASKYGINLKGAQNTIIKGNTIKNTHCGVYEEENADYNYIINNFFENNVNNYITIGSNTVVENNTES